MKPERREQIETLFHDVAELPAAEQAGFLERACGGDDDLRREVERMLHLDHRAERYFAGPLLGERRGGDNGAAVGPPRRVLEVLRQVAERPAQGRDDADAIWVSGEATAVMSEFHDPTDLPTLEEFDEAPLHRTRFAPGTLIAERYRIVALLGAGGMGEVYRAEDLKLRQTVAIKVLNRSLEEDRKTLERFLDEVRIARQISHPNVCRVYDVGEIAGAHFISMEYIDGENLASMFSRSGRLPREKAFKIGLELCHGLAAAHQKGVLHRDFKPANLMLDQHGTARVTDFGLAVLAEKITGVEARSGTPAYMAPEQHAGLEATVQSDLYALGLVLYELFTGFRAFRGSSRAELARSHREMSPIRPSALQQDISPAIERVILECLSKNPRDRSISALAVARALADGAGSTLKTLVAVELKQQVLEPSAAGDDPLRRLADPLLDRYEGQRLALLVRLDHSSVLIAVFDRPINAVHFALTFHDAASSLDANRLETRIGIHLGEIYADGGSGQHALEAEDVEAGALEVSSADLEVIERLATVALGGQTLISRGAFDLARQRTLDGLAPPRWLAHGSYEVRGLSAAIEICEVGIDGRAPFCAPEDSPMARRQIVQETVSGWRPAPRLELPQRPDWVMVKKLNEGGFGEVWLARHQKTHERRIFKFCYDSARVSSLQREITIFRLLKEALGDREDITRILDWNFDESPYYIEAEYTEGGSLSEWATEQGGLDKIPLAVRLEIVAQVATALAAAHSVGVLHKDVKPGNVLITVNAEGGIQASLNDFGLGLLTEKRRLNDLAITALGFTEMPGPGGSDDLYAGTHLYMAPELLEGRPATVQSDVYALGVMLFQVIAGDFTRALASGWEREISDRLLREDIASAIDGSAERRLSSAGQLAARLRHLEQRWIEGDDLRRRLEEAEEAKLALSRGKKRRRLFAVVLLVALLFSSITFFQAQRIANEAESAQQAANLLMDLFRVADPGEGQGKDLTVRELLDLGVVRLEDQIAEDSRLLGPLLHTIGTVYRNLGQYDQAAQQLEKALEAQRQVHGEEHAEIAATLNVLADVKRRQGERAKAEELSEEALAMRRKVLGEDHPDVAESLEQYGQASLFQGKIKKAEGLFREALAMRLEIYGEDHLLVASTMVRLASLLGMKDSLDESEELLRKALSIRLRQIGYDHPDVADSFYALAQLLESRGAYGAAKPYFQKALDMRRRLLDHEHPDVAETMRSLALLEKEEGDLVGAVQLINEALQIHRPSLGDDHLFVATLLEDLGRISRLKGEWSSAETLFQQSLSIRRDRLGAAHPVVAASLEELGTVARETGQYDLADSYWQQVLESYRELGGAETPWYAFSLRNLAMVDFSRGATAEAMVHLEQALDIFTQLEFYGWQMARTLTDYARALQVDGQVAKAEATMRQGVAHYWRIYGSEHPRTAFEMQDLAEMLTAMGKFEAAEEVARQAIAILEASLPEESWRFQEARNVLSWCLSKAGETDRAEKELVESCAGLRTALGSEAPRVRDCERRLVLFFESQGRVEEADAFRRLEVDWAIPNQF